MFLDELKAYRQWIVRRADKIPLRACDLRNASVTNPADWATFDEAQAACQAHGLGLGFVLSAHDPFTVIDLDPTTDESVRKSQIEIFEAFQSYTERSPSGEGAHIWVKGFVQSRRLGSKKLEVYSTERYMTVTLDPVRDLPVVEAQSLLNDLIRSIDAVLPQKPIPVTDSKPQTRTDQQVYDAAAGATNGAKFTKLWAGDWSEYPSHSEADMALVNILAFYTDSKEQVARMWADCPLGLTQPKRTREKWVVDMVNKSFDQKVPAIDLAAATAHMAELFARKKAEQAKPVDALEFPPGMVGEIAQFIYSAAWSPLKEVAIAGALAYVAGFVGRAYNISDFGLNQYFVVLAKTGQGKDAAKTGIGKLNMALQPMLGSVRLEAFIGPEMIASPQGLLNRINETPCCMSILPEFGKLLQELNDARATPTARGIKTALLRLYSASGPGNGTGSSAYSDKAKNANPIVSPSYTILGEGTPSSFYTALSEDAVSDGFIPRLTILEYEGDIPPSNKNAKDARPSHDLLLRLQELVRHCWAVNSNLMFVEIQVEPDAQHQSDELFEFCKSQTNKYNNIANSEHLAELWTRVHARTLKLAGLVAVGCDKTAPMVTLDIFNWAARLVARGTYKVIDRFAGGEIGVPEGDHLLFAALKRLLENYINKAWDSECEKNFRVGEQAKAAGVVSKHYIENALLKTKLFRSHRLGASFALKNTIKSFEESGSLIAIDKDDFVARQTSKGGKREGQLWRICDL